MYIYIHTHIHALPVWRVGDMRTDMFSSPGCFRRRCATGAAVCVGVYWVLCVRQAYGTA